MKTKEQIELAEQTIELLKDYIELAKVEKKLKDKDIIEQTSKVIEKAVGNLKANVNEL